MGKELYDNFPQAKDIIDRSNDILKFDLRKLCFEGPQEELSTTKNSQPAILAVSIAALKAYESSPVAAQFVPKFSLGLSLGEYTALVAAGSISFEDALTLVRRRGEFMEDASKRIRARWHVSSEWSLAPSRNCVKASAARWPT